MGNMVTFSVLHDCLDDIVTDDFRDITALMGESDYLFKTYAPDARWVDGFCSPSRLPGVVSSRYHHADDSVDLLISNSLLCLLPYKIDTRSHRQQLPLSPSYSPAVVKSGVRDYLSVSRRGLVKHEQSPALNPNRSRYTVFGYYTDHCHELDKNPHLVAEILRYCRTGDISTSVCPDRSATVRPIGTFDADVSCVVNMYRGMFSTTRLRYSDLYLNPEAQLEVVEANKTYNSKVRDRHVHKAIVDSLASSLGCVVADKAPKTDSEATWERK